MKENMRVYAGLLFASLIAIQGASLFGAPPSFAAREEVPLAAQVFTLADINKDGSTDIVAAVQNPSNSGIYEVSIQLGNSKGTFTQGPTIYLGTGFVPTTIVAGDFNGDGLPDIAILSSSQQELYIALQQPSGGFLIEPIQIPGNLYQTLNMVAVDINRDKLTDLIIPTSSGTLLLLNSGGGHFRTPLYASSQPAGFAVVADLNNDKNPDLILGPTFCCASVAILLGDGHGGFDAPLSQPNVGSSSAQVAVGDFNGDGKPDLAVASSYSSIITVVNGNGDGTFGTPYSLNLPLPLIGLGVIAADVNNDSRADLIALQSGYPESALAVFLNAGHGAFLPPVLYPVQSNPNFFAIGNLNSDALPDAVVSSFQGSLLSLLVNNGKGGFRDGETLPTSTTPLDLVAGDFNGDGKPDLVSLSQNGVTPFLNSGSNQALFSPLATLPFTGQILVAGDFNNDQRLDVVVLNNGNGQTLLGNGDGTFFYLPFFYNVGPVSTVAVAADMNGDGKLDIVTAFPSVALGNGDGTFSSPVLNGFNCYSPQSVAVADLNRDGKPDIVFTCEGSLYLALGNGDGTLQYPSSPGYFPGLLYAAVGDFNRDGIPDIAFSANPSFFLPASTQVNILIGQGNGTFSNGAVIEVPTGSTGQLVVGDFNGNGLLDIAVLDSFDSVFSVVSGNGDGTFQPARSYGTATNPACIISGRFRAGSKLGEKDLVFCTGAGIGVAINTTQ